MLKMLCVKFTPRNFTMSLSQILHTYGLCDLVYYIFLLNEKTVCL